MLLIHVPRLTNRLGYTLNVVFRHLLHTEFNITTDDELFEAHDGPKLCYGPRRIAGALHIKNCKLLFETSIEEKEVHAGKKDGTWVLFPVYGQDLDMGFDVLAATFYLVSRYEEYLPHRTDIHGRFTPDQSIGVQAGFIAEPVVDQWACKIRELLLQRYPDMDLPQPTYHFVQTVDIDAAWAYLHKGLFRTVAGSLRDLVSRRDMAAFWQRWRVLRGRDADPFDTFDYIIERRLQEASGKLIFFALLADYGQYDKPSSYQNPHTRELLQHLDDYASMGIHPGYNALEEPRKVDIETHRMEAILHRTISKARYHFLRLRLPTSYRTLLHAGLKDDYTMGYADAVGFRAGISVKYPFYDLERDMETELMIHPFCVMDTTLKKYMHLSPNEGLETYKSMIDSVRRVGGTFCCIIHNQNLCDSFGWDGWRQVYEQMLEAARQ